MYTIQIYRKRDGKANRAGHDRMLPILCPETLLIDESPEIIGCSASLSQFVMDAFVWWLYGGFPVASSSVEFVVVRHRDRAHRVGPEVHPEASVDVSLVVSG